MLDNTVLGIDVSGYQDPDKVNYPALAAHGFKFVVVKLNEALTDEHVSLAKAAGLEVGGYGWHDPTLSASTQAAKIIAEVKRLALRFAGLDVEQDWSSWSAYWQFCAKKITRDQVPKLAPAQIAASAKSVMTTVAGARPSARAVSLNSQ